jgi:hydrogenase maturation protease
LDSIVTGQHCPGTVLEFAREDFDKVTGPSPHYAGLPEVLALAERLGVAFPEEIRILAMEIESPYDFTETLSAVVEQAVPAYVAKARRILRQWKDKDARNLAHTKSAGECSAANQGP